MKKGIKKAISTIAILTMTFQIGMPMVPGLQTTVLATDTTNSVEEVQENTQPTADKAGTIALSESADATPTEEISRNYEIKEEEKETMKSKRKKLGMYQQMVMEVL